MFNYSDIGAQGRERVNTFQREARQHDLAGWAHRPPRQSKKDHSRLLGVLSAIRSAFDRVKGTGVKPEMSRRNFWRVYDTARIK